MLSWFQDFARAWWAWMWPMFWQVTLLILLVAAVDRLIRRHAWPQVRLALWSLVLIKLLLPPTLTSPISVTSRLLPDTTGMAGLDIVMRPDATLVTTGAVTRNAFNNAQSVAPDESGIMTLVGEQWPVWTISAWLAGIALLGVSINRRLLQLRRSLAIDIVPSDESGRPLAVPEWLDDTLRRAAAALGLRRLPRVALSPALRVPAVFGLWRPIVILPLDTFDTMSRQDVRNVLLHELAHIKRGDMFWHAAVMTLQTLYWFHPLLWLVRKHVHDLRELCCDATVARVLRERTGEYRETLLRSVIRLLDRGPVGSLGLLGLFEGSSNTLLRLRWLERDAWRHPRWCAAATAAVWTIMAACVLPMSDGAPVLTLTEYDEPVPRSPGEEFCEAAAAGDVAKVMAMLKQDESLLLAPSAGPLTRGRRFLPMHFAAGGGAVEVMSLLRERGADVNAESPGLGWTPLHFALDSRKEESVRWLVDHGARVDVWAASAMGDLKKLASLLNAVPSLVMARGPGGATPLHFAGTLETAELLLAHGADLNARDEMFQAAPVRWHAFQNDLVARYLISRGAEEDIFVAAALDNAERVQAMIRQDPKLLTHRTMASDALAPNATPLRIAAALGRTRVVRLLADAGATVNARGGSTAATALHAAVWNGHMEAAKLLIERGACLEAIDRTRRATPLEWAVTAGRVDMVRMLISSGAKVTPCAVRNAEAGRRGELRSISGAKQSAYEGILGCLRGSSA